MINCVLLAMTFYDSLDRLCTTTSTPHLFKFTPIAPLTYEFFLTILTIVKAFDFEAHPSRSGLPFLVKYFRES